MSQEFLGVGWKYPVQLFDQEVSKGEIALSRHEEDVHEAVWIILSTAPGERVMRPDFGCGIHEYVFAPNNARTASMVRFRVEEALTYWEPRIDLLEVHVQPDRSDPAVLLIDVEYRVRSTDSRFNLVFPFYLQREVAE